MNVAEQNRLRSTRCRVRSGLSTSHAVYVLRCRCFTRNRCVFFSCLKLLFLRRIVDRRFPRGSWDCPDLLSHWPVPSPRRCRPSVLRRLSIRYDACCRGRGICVGAVSCQCCRTRTRGAQGLSGRSPGQGLSSSACGQLRASRLPYGSEKSCG